MDDRILALVIISIILLVLAGIMYSDKYFALIEGYDISPIDKEAIQNVASIYNNENMIVSNINLTKSLTVAPDGKISFLPKGIIVAWNGTTAPAGWALCDGNNGTPNLQDRFILGKTPTNQLGKTGGSWTVTLTEDNLPAHSHGFSVGGGDGNDNLGEGVTEGYPCSNCKFQAKTRTTGKNSPFQVIPPYYVLAYIMKL